MRIEWEGASYEDGKKENQQDVNKIKRLVLNMDMLDASIKVIIIIIIRDVALIAEIGFTSYRFSINSSRYCLDR